MKGTWDSTYLGVELDDDVTDRQSVELEAIYRTDEGRTDVVFLFNSGEDGVIVLSANSNVSLYNEMEEALDRSTLSVDADTFRADEANQ